MNRRQWLRVFTATGATLLIAPWLPGCGDDGARDPQCPDAPASSDDAFDGWQAPAASDDLRLQLLSYALLAPNAHNLQSWKVVLTAPDTLELHVEPTRLLPASDPFYRQIHVSVGAFLEVLELAAKHLGQRAEIKLFPDGEYGADLLEDAAVARIRLVADTRIVRDPLFDQVLARRSGKSPYDGKPVAEAQLSALRAALGPGPGTLTCSSDPSLVATIVGQAIRASDIDFAAVHRFEETVDAFRFTDAELRAQRNGLDVRFLVEMGLNRQAVLANHELFRQQADQQQQQLARSTATWGWITTASNTRRDQILVGRQYVRINLAATGLGVSMHPNSQALQEYPDMAQLQRELLTELAVPSGHTVQMLVRLGYGSASAPSARKRWIDFTSCG